MTPTVILIHGGESTVEKLRQAVPGAQVTVVYQQGLSSAYNEVTGVASRFKTLRSFLAEFAPWWKPGDPLVLLGYSAGGWALRYYLRDASARKDVSAAVFLDSTYGNDGEVCRIDPYHGVVKFGLMANAEPSKHRLIMTYSASHPGPRVCATAIERLIGPGPGVFVRGYSGDHGSQQGIVGPAIVKELVTPWIGGAGGGFSLATAAGLALLLLGGGLIWSARG